MHLTINIVVNLPGEGGWIKMEFWKSGLLNDFALAVAVNRFLTEPIKIQQLDFRGRRRWSHHEAPVSLCNGWNFGCGSGRSQMTEGAGYRFDSLSCDYSLQGKKSITGRRQSGVWSELQTPADIRIFSVWQNAEIPPCLSMLWPCGLLPASCLPPLCIKWIHMVQRSRSLPLLFLLSRKFCNGPGTVLLLADLSGDPCLEAACLFSTVTAD